MNLPCPARATAAHRRSPGSRALALALAAAALLAACGGGGGGGDGDEPPPPEARVVAGRAVVKARAAGAGWAALAEQLRALQDVTRPDRQLLLATGPGRTPLAIGAPAGWSLIDLAVHPSGQLSLVLATDKTLRLQRRAADGTLLGESDFIDAQAASDPFTGDPIVIRDANALLPHATRDAVRLAPLGEDLVLALRSGRNAVVAQRLAHAGGGRFDRVWRTLVEPGVFIGGLGLTSGSFDPFGGLDNQWKLLLDVDAQGRSAVAVSLGLTELVEGHAQHFGEALPAGLSQGVLLTRLDAQGRRLGSTVVDTRHKSELHALRWTDDAVWLGGRVRSQQRPDGGGWDGWVARVPATGAAQAAVQLIDVDQGDVVLDLAPLADGRLLLAGSTGYWQNPAGGSISEAAAPLLAVLPAAGGAPQRLALPAGPRHNQLRTLAPWQGRWLLGGLENGPGTHSADADPALLRGDGYLRELAGPSAPR